MAWLWPKSPKRLCLREPRWARSRGWTACTRNLSLILTMLAFLLTDVVRNLIAAGAGAIIGLSFGLLQFRALRRNEERRDTGALNSHWKVMLGAPRRIAWFLICLVGI